MTGSETENIKRLIENKDMQFRDFRLTRAEEADGGSLIVEGVPCVFDTETVLFSADGYELRETIDKGAFLGAEMRDVIFNYNHCGRVFAKTRNGTLSLTVDERGLSMSARLMSEDEGHRQLYRDIKSGLIDKMSFAFTVGEKETRSEETDGGTIVVRQRITKIKRLYDVSAVDIPAYDATEISARHAFCAESERRGAESRKRAMDIIKIKLKMEETK